MRYPFDLEWMEGGSVDHVAWLLQGKSLYGPPQVAFIPFEYPPLYYYLAALLAKVAGVGYTPLRLVSLLSSAVVLACLYRIVKTETGDAVAGLAAAGLFAATFRIGGAWLDLARVDSLFLAFFLLGLVELRRGTTIGDHVLAGTWFALASLTKQPALAMVLPLVMCSVYARPRQGLALAATIIGVTGVATWLLQVMSGGWYTFYVWWFPFVHALVSTAWTTFWTSDMLARLPVAFPAAVALSAALLLRPTRENLFWPATFAGALAAAYRARLQTGGYDNVLLPAYVAIAMLAGLGIGRIVRQRPRWVTVAHGACFLQMALLVYDPRQQVPSAADRAAGAHLVRELEAIPGDVFVPYHGNLSRAAGKSVHAHLMQVFDILKLGDQRSAALAEDVRSAIRRQTFGAIVLNDRFEYFFKSDVEVAYTLKTVLFTDPDVFYPVTGGLVSRPQYLYVPKPRPASRIPRP